MFELLKKLKKKELILVFISFVFIIMQVWLELKIPDYMSQITKLVQSPTNEFSEILMQGTYMLLCSLGSVISAVSVGYFSSYVSSAFSRNVRKEIFNKIGNFGMEEINKFSTPSLITRTTNDITKIELFISIGMQAIIKAPIMAVWAIFKILNKGWEWTTATSIAIVFLVISVITLMILVLPRFRKIQKLTDDLNKTTRENLTGIKIVRAFNAEKYQEDKFEIVNEDVSNTHLFTSRVMGVMNPLMHFIMSSLTLAIYIIGAYLINTANMLDKIDIFSNMVVFSSYSMQVIMSFIMLVLVFAMYPRASISAKRILEVLKIQIKIKDGNITNVQTTEKGTVEFRDVSFKYPDSDEYMLKDISFKANKGETVAFIGSTGSGKSTLINLIPRFYDVTEGEVLIDGIDVREYTQETLHNKIGYIPQKAVMFDGSISYNVAYGDNGKEKPNERQIKKAVQIAQGKEFVENMSDKYNSHIARGGTNISGGQRQRLAIARAIAKEPEIYIFDDSFSALDYKTDTSLRKDLKKYTEDATILIVAQRIGTIITADKIIVLNDGECVGMGTHKELMQNCEIYQEIAYSQLNKEELDNA